jgi:hypothetical protein
MVKRPRTRIPERVRTLVMERDHHLCVYCGLPAEVVDHVVPHCRGGADDPSNLVAACRKCNGKASGLSFKTFDLKKAFILDPTRRTPSVMDNIRMAGGRESAKRHPVVVRGSANPGRWIGFDKPVEKKRNRYAEKLKDRHSTD